MTQPSQIGLNEALSIIEAQKSIINALENEVRWYDDVISNPAFGEVDIRIAVKTTPREMRMGLITEAPERKVFYPDLAEKVHASPKVTSQHVRTLEKTGLFAYRTEKDEATGNTRAYLKPLPPLAAPAQIERDRPRRGGSTWENGNRVKFCKECGSTHLLKRTQVQCPDCGSIVESEWKPVNAPEEANSQDDTEPMDTPNCQDDTRPPQGNEISNLPPVTVDTPGIEVEVETVLPPEELRKLPIWACHLAKEPYIAELPRRYPKNAKSNDPTTWRTYDQAVKIYEQSIREQWKNPFDGIGFMCNGDFTVTDLDHCITEGKVSDQAAARYQTIDSYSEVSYSGTGVHTIALGSIPRNVKQPGVEMYDHVRFITWTGKHIIGTPLMIADRQELLTALHSEITPKREPKEPKPAQECVYASCSDEEVLDKARTRANSAKFIRLYDDGDITGYPSQSEADLALCRMLAYWTDCDESAIDRLFRDSKLYREKWDEPARAGETYGEGTIRIALGEREQVAS